MINNNYITDNILPTTYKTNANENIQKNLKKSLIISGENKISLDLLMEEAKKKYNKNKIDSNRNINDDKSIITENTPHDNNSNKLKQFYAEHLTKRNSKNKTKTVNDNKNNNNIHEVFQSYECHDKNKNSIDNQKILNVNLNIKEKSKNNDKINTQNDFKKKKSKK